MGNCQFCLSQPAKTAAVPNLWGCYGCVGYLRDLEHQGASNLWTQLRNQARKYALARGDYNA